MYLCLEDSLELLQEGFNLYDLAGKKIVYCRFSRESSKKAQQKILAEVLGEV